MPRKLHVTHGMQPANPGNNPPFSLSHRELFLGCAKIGLMGFGGVAAVARHVIVTERNWLDDRDYAATLGLGQLLPGPNIVNSVVMIGARFQGITGSLAAITGIMSGPLCVAVGLVTLYDRFAYLPEVQSLTTGAAAGAAGLIVGTALKMLRRIKPDIGSLAVTAAAVMGAAVFRLPLLLVVACLAPFGIALSWRKRTG